MYLLIPGLAVIKNLQFLLDFGMLLETTPLQRCLIQILQLFVYLSKSRSKFASRNFYFVQKYGVWKSHIALKTMSILIPTKHF